MKTIPTRLHQVSKIPVGIRILLAVMSIVLGESISVSPARASETSQIIDRLDSIERKLDRIRITPPRPTTVQVLRCQFNHSYTHSESDKLGNMISTQVNVFDLQLVVIRTDNPQLEPTAITIEEGLKWETCIKEKAATQMEVGQPTSGSGITG